MPRVFGRLAWLSTMLVLALWGTTGAVEDVQLVYVGSTATTTWRGIEQGLREANILGGFTGYTYTVEPVSPEALLEAPRDEPCRFGRGLAGCPHDAWGG